ncbi:MAG: hypothetical protein QGG31_06070, partial [Anaerolineales bacterium]|nr:hypothetical protein [Anaerolineales bacterium]
MSMIGPRVLLLGFATAFALAWPGTWLFRQFAQRIGLLDTPNFRSSHAGPIPGAGGVVFVVVSPLVALVVAQ